MMAIKNKQEISNRKYHILSESWYSGSALKGRDFLEEVIIRDGNIEFGIRWYKICFIAPISIRVTSTISPKIEIYDDMWGAFDKMRDVFDMFASVVNCDIPPRDLCRKLNELGFTDATKRTRKE